MNFLIWLNINNNYSYCIYKAAMHCGSTCPGLAIWIQADIYSANIFI